MDPTTTTTSGEAADAIPQTSSSTPSFASTLGYDTLAFVSCEAFVTHSAHFKFIKSLVDFLDKNHKQGYASALRTFVKLQCAKMSPDERMPVFGINGFYVLLKNNKIVAVAQLDGATTISTITVPKAERGKGHAKAILRILAHEWGKRGLCIISPTYLSHERLLVSVGWTRFNDELCRDGTVDLMPEHSKTRYRLAMEKKDKQIYGNDEQSNKELASLVLMNMMMARNCSKIDVPKK